MTKVLEFIRSFVMCDGCGAQEIDELSDKDFADHLEKKGWRVSGNGHINCPKCSEKFKIRRYGK